MDWSVTLRINVALTKGEMGGRNHALFEGIDGRLFVQAWLHPRLIIVELPPRLSPGFSRAPGLGEKLTPPSVLKWRAGQIAKECAHLHLSGTTPLVPLRLRGERAKIHGSRILLGVGHVHHSPIPNRSYYANSETMAKIRGGIAYFGSHYMHFFYALSASPPHALIAHSAEWCLPSTQGARTCEVVQFVAGLEIAHGDMELLLSWGANDCESRIATIPTGEALALLEWPVSES